MKKLVIASILIMGCSPVWAQNLGSLKTSTITALTCANCFLNDGHISSVGDYMSREDTTAVIAYCLDTETLVTTWRKIYAIYGFSKPYVSFNGLIIYKEYLMPDRKTKSIYRVIYSIQK